jgi:hypothetical protein
VTAQGLSSRAIEDGLRSSRVSAQWGGSSYPLSSSRASTTSLPGTKSQIYLTIGVIVVSENGWTTNELGLQWLKHINAHTKRRTVDTHRLLITVGHDSHDSLDSSSAARRTTLSLSVCILTCRISCSRLMQVVTCQ